MFHYAEKSETIVTISPDALPALLAILAKFEAWEKTAREKNGTTFTKVIGKLDRQEVYFRWSREGQSVDLMLPKPPVPEAVQAKFGVAYISGIRQLAKQYPDAKAEAVHLNTVARAIRAGTTKGLE